MDVSGSHLILIPYYVICASTGELMGDVADPDCRVHGREAGGVLLPGARR